METRNLEIQTRTLTGKEESGRLKRTGMIPAIFYGAGRNSVPLAVDSKKLLEAIDTEAGENTLLTFKAKGLKELDKRVVIIKDKQLHPITKDLIHVDFYEIAMDKKITIEVPTVFVGKPVGVEEGGVLQVLRRELEAECLPTAIPEKIEIDVSNLKIGDAIHIQDITPPEGVSFKFEKNLTIVTVAAPMKEEAPEVAEAVEGAEAAPLEGEEAKPTEDKKAEAAAPKDAKAKTPEKEKAAK